MFETQKLDIVGTHLVHQLGRSPGDELMMRNI